MQTVNIKTHRQHRQYAGSHFYLLSKGYNAGKPLDKPCPNCFVLTFDTEEQMKKIYWICYAIWKAGRYLPLLCGSVIPFIRLDEVRAEIEKGIRFALRDEHRLSKHVSQLHALIRSEKHLTLQLKLTGELKIAIASQILSERPDSGKKSTTD